ncbi:MAG TPA: pitrilysin family protein [Gemmatimonadales bacterium]|nr:pitrilysin family protein [Gemmatimonadales bacterium]
MTLRWTEDVRRVVLANGLTLLVQRDPTAPAVAVVSHVRAGFFDEPDRLSGISHVLEHMLFKGTPTRGVGQIAQETKAAGGYLNAATSYDHTTYYAVLPAGSLAVALDLQSDALRRSTLDQEELRRELRVIIEEARRKLDTPSAVASETLAALLFDRHRIRRWRIGTEAQLAALSHDDLAGYYRSRYVPERTIVAMTGDLDPDLALDAARECFGGWPAAAGAEDPSPEEPPRREVRTQTLRGDVRRADLVVGWRGVPALHPDAAALDVAAAVLGTGRASWLYRALRAPGVVMSIGAWHYSPTEVGIFSVSADLDAPRLREALEGIAASVSRLRSSGPSSDDLSRVRRVLRARWARRLETVEGRASALAAAEALGGVALLDEEYERLLAVTADDVRRVAIDWLAPDLVSAVAFLPDAAETDLTGDLLRASFEKTGPPPPEANEPPVPPVPPPVAVHGSSTSGVLHVELPGVDLLIGRKPGVPLVSIGVYRRRTVRDTVRAAGLSALAVRSAVRGAGGMDPAGLALAFERLGGGLSPHVSADWFGFGTSVLSDQASEGAGLLHTVLHAPEFTEAEVVLERGTLTDEVAQVADDMLRFPLQLALRAGFGDSGYGLPVQGLLESVPTLSDGMVRGWHACELAFGRTAVVAVGDLEPERFAERLAGWFGGDPPRESAPIVDAGRWREAGDPAVVAVERAKRQTGLAMLFPGPSRTDPDRYAAMVWSAIASGLGGRLFHALRDSKSLAYTVIASSWQRAGAGALVLYLATSPEREDEARDALLHELGRFREEPPDRAELVRAISYLSGQAQVQRQTAAGVAGEVAESWLMGTGLEELADPAAGFKRVTAEAVRELAQRYLDPGLRVEGIVRGRPTGPS